MFICLGKTVHQAIVTVSHPTAELRGGRGAYNRNLSYSARPKSSVKAHTLTQANNSWAKRDTLT